MSEWKTIDSAPRDGTVVDLWIVDQDGNGERVCNARWEAEWGDERHTYNPNGAHKLIHFTRAGWVAPGFDYDGQDGLADMPNWFNEHPRQNRWMFRKPTHWMPLPSPPETRDE